MKPSRIKELRAELEAERIDLSELSEIETAFSELPDEFLRDERENAMAGDQLDELERWNENAIHRATDKFTRLTHNIGGSHGMLVGAMHKLIYDELNNGSGNWDNSISRLARQTVTTYLDDQAPKWLMKNHGNHWSLPAAEQDRKPKHVTDASWIKLIDTVLVWLRVDEAPKNVEMDVLCEMASAIVERQFFIDSKTGEEHSFTDENGDIRYIESVQDEFNVVLDILDEIANPEK